MVLCYKSTIVEVKKEQLSWLSCLVRSRNGASRLFSPPCPTLTTPSSELLLTALCPVPSGTVLLLFILGPVLKGVVNTNLNIYIFIDSAGGQQQSESKGNICQIFSKHQLPVKKCNIYGQHVVMCSNVSLPSLSA